MNVNKARETNPDALVSKPDAPAHAPKPAKPAVHTKDRNPANRAQWKRDRAKALGHAR